MELCATKAGTRASLGLHSGPFEAPPKLGCGLAQPGELSRTPGLFPGDLSQLPFQETQEFNIYWILGKIQLSYFTSECTEVLRGHRFAQDFTARIRERHAGPHVPFRQEGKHLRT